VTVIVLQRVSPGTRGLLSRWLVEVATGVFVGRTTARVRDRIWHRVAEEAGAAGGSALLVHDAPTPEGYAFRQVNPRGRVAEPVDGVALVRLVS